MRLNKLHPRFRQMLEEATATPVPRLAYDFKELAAGLGVSYPTIYRLYRRGKIAVVRVGTKKLLVSAQEAQRFLIQNETREPLPGHLGPRRKQIKKPNQTK